MLTPVLRAMIDDLRAGRRAGAIAAGFHLAVARLIADVADDLRDRTGLDRVALSGGVFQNVLLVRLTRGAAGRTGLHRPHPSGRPAERRRPRPRPGGRRRPRHHTAASTGGSRRHVNDRDSPGLADDLAAAALTLARRFAAGATMWCVSPRWPAHGRHVAVEFVHPVIVGKRALPAVHVDGGDLVGAVRLLARPGDVILAIGPADDDRSSARCSGGRTAWGLTEPVARRRSAADRRQRRIT